MSYSDGRLKGIDLFSGLSAQELDLVKDHLIEKTFHEKDVIVQQGGLGHDLYIILSGIADVWVRLPGDYEKKATELSKGQLFGEVAFLAEQPFTATAIAHEKLNCLIFPRHILDMLRVAHPDIAYKIEHVIAQQAKKKITDYLYKIRELIHTVTINQSLRPGHGFYLPNAKAKSTPINLDELNPEILKKIPVFSQLPEDDFRQLQSFMTVTQFDKGFNFHSATNSVNSLNIIYSGAVMLFLKHDKRLIKALNVIGVGTLFLNNNADQEFTSIASYVACERCVTLQIQLKNYIKLQRLHPQLFYKLSQHLHSSIVGSIFILNREFVRINCEFSELTS